MPYTDSEQSMRLAVRTCRGVLALGLLALSAVSVVQAQTPPEAPLPNTAPDLNKLFQVVPLAPPAAPTDSKRAYAPMSSRQMEAGATPIAQVLGSTTQGTLTKAYTIAHLRAADVQTLLSDPMAPLLPRDASTVIIDARSNTLIVKGTEAEHQLVENLIRRVDVPVKQILIEAKIFSADDYFGKSLGAKFGITSSHMLNAATPRQQGVQIGGNVGDLNTIATTGSSGFPSMVSLPATNSLTSAAVSTFALGIYKLPAGINIGLEISALEEAGHTKVLSSPKLILTNFKPGVLSSGQRIPYSKPSLVQGVNTTEFVDAKVSISVTALVAPDGTISMDLTLTDDSVGSTSAIGPTINTNQLTSNVTLRSGETLVLGGFQSATQTEDSNKTPYLAEIPVLGYLFKNRAHTSVKRELLFTITPTVIESP